VADRYRRLFSEAGLAERIRLPLERLGCRHVYNQFVIGVPEIWRDPLRAHLTKERIGTEVYYPIPLHLQTCFAPLGHKPGDFPRSEAAARQTLALPIYPELSANQQSCVVGAISEFARGRSFRAA
jgi:dTDP-4-amino-4,6-dideoxygalactose transaminase